MLKNIGNLTKHLLVAEDEYVVGERLNGKKGLRKMDENQINAALNKVDGYIGTYSLDELPDLRVRIFPSFIIVNLDLRKNKGTHWIALALYLNDIYVCDSLGTLLPNDKLPFHLINFLHLISYNKTLHISKQLQATSSSTCGKYATYFVYCMSCSNLYKSFLSNFSLNYELNDIIISLLFTSIL